MDIVEIANLHNRDVDSILDRLLELKYINNKQSSRGYDKYISIIEINNIKSEIQILKNELDDIKLNLKPALKNKISNESLSVSELFSRAKYMLISRACL